MSESLSYQNLIAGDQKKLVTLPITVKSGENIVVGQLLGKITTGGKCVPMDSTAHDGSEKPFAVATEDVDATDGDTLSTGYTEGDFNEDAITYGYGDTADDVRDACKAVGIYLRKTVSVSGQ